MSAIPYAKITGGGTCQFMPMVSLVGGSPVRNDSEARAAWRAENGWLPYVEGDAPAPSGSRIPVQTGYDTDGSVVSPVWTLVEISEAPVRAIAKALAAGVSSMTQDAKDAALARLAKIIAPCVAALLCLGACLRASAESVPVVARSGDLTSDSLVATNVAAAPVPLYMWPGDWYIRVTDAGSQAAGISSIVTNDMEAAVAGSSGLWRSYRVSAEADPVALAWGDEPPSVTFDYSDSAGAVAVFTNDVLVSSGVAGTVRVTGTDTNGVVRRASVVMTPVSAGRVTDFHYAEVPGTERHIWATNLLSRLAAVSTNAADMVVNYQCRTFANRYANATHAQWASPRALSRFGSDGRVRTNEWAGLKSVSGVRGWSTAWNRDFFWPQLWTNLWCFSATCHETSATCASTGWSANRNHPWMAIAPHYVITAAHYEDWMCTAWDSHPRFPKSGADGDYCVAHLDFPRVATVPNERGDIKVFRTTAAIPAQCIARFAPPEVLRHLSPTLFAKAPCLTVNAHQTVSPYPLGSPSHTLYSWTAEPRTSTARNRYPAGGAIPAAAWLEHMGHMYDSGDFFFLASPRGQVVPLGQTYSLSDGGGLNGPTYYGDGVLESLAEVVRTDSGGAEDLSYWTFEDLWCGGATNALEVVNE